jgi:hypothetical protein
MNRRIASSHYPLSGQQSARRPSCGNPASRFRRKQRHNNASQSTLDALTFEVRTLGLAALEDPSCLRRLDDVSTAQLREVLSRLIRVRLNHPAITDDLLLKLGGLL